ncbi:MAG TPA: ATP-dependent helicase [Lysobacter sp.]
MNLTTEQLAAVEAEGNAYVQACPGSGKTRVLVAKAIRELAKVSGTPRRIACITFTNTAVDEMEHRLRLLAGDGETSSVDVGTIHSFCLANIFKPFRCRVSSYASGFEIVSGDDERSHDLFRTLAKRIGVTPKPFHYDLIGQVAMDEFGDPVQGDFEPWIVDCMRDYWAEFRSRGWVDFSLLLYESLSILRNHPEVRASLSAKYLSVLVDEFQDTTAVQLEILSHIHSSGASVFFLVGDPHQSIYGFAGASPKASGTFISDTCACTLFALSGNFRSAKPIVAHSDGLIPRTPGMEAVGDNADAPAEITAYSTHSVATSVVNRFLASVHALGLNVGSSAVLAARWTDLLPVARACVQHGIPVVGPGARPYRRGRLIAPLLEHLAATTTDKGSLRSTQRALERCATELEGFNRAAVEGWAGRVISLELHKEAKCAAQRTQSPLDWIVSVGDQIDRVLSNRGVGESGAFRASADDIVSDIRANARLGRVEIEKLTIESLGLFANPSKAIKLMTVHAAKGREFDAVALIHMNEGRFPHFKARTSDQISEGRRVTYVGMTRAKQLLHLIVDTSDSRDGPSRFLREMGLG